MPPPSEPVAPPGLESDGVSRGGPFFERVDWLTFLLTSGGALAVYLFTMAPEVTLENSGMLVTGAAYAGVPHIPGYPVWTLWAWLFTKLLPFSNFAWRVGVASGVAAALAAGLIALLVSHGGKMLLEKNAAFTARKPSEQNLLRLGSGCAAGLGLGLSSSVWPQAVVAETWTFGLFLFTAIFCLLLRWLHEPARRRYLYGAIYLYGALLTGNQELVLAGPALLVFVIIGDTKIGRDFFLLLALMVGIGCWSRLFSPLIVFQSYTNHNLLLLFAFVAIVIPAVVVIIKTRRAGTHLGGATLCMIFLLLGVSWYLYLPVASMTNPPMNWGYPRTVNGFIHAISRGQMQMCDPVKSVVRFAEQSGTLVRRTGDGLGWTYLVFAALPLCLIYWMPPLMRKWVLGLIAAFICVGPLMLATLNPAKERASWDMITPYFSSMYAVLVIFAGLGLVAFSNRVVKVSSADHFHRE